MGKPKATEYSKVVGLKFKDYNGCREMDRDVCQENLKLAPLDGTLSEFIQWLNELGEDEHFWWRGIGWTEGFRYFAFASESGQQTYFSSLKLDRDVRYPEWKRIEALPDA